MKVINYFFVFILVTSIAVAQDLNDYNNLEIESKFSSNLNLNYVESDYKLEYVIANLTFFPKNNDFQKSVYSITSSPNAEITENEEFILYRWNKPEENKLNYSLISNIKTQTNFKHIKEKIKFPLEDINGLEQYTKESETVTSNDPKIIKKASELAQGEDDLFKVVHKIGLWTKENINYSLETLTAEVSQNASWVLENEKGVCDELTSLFVAMLRSINIPARFVTGQAYTNVLDDFGNHAWAEVYFPGYGWIPFDPTYGQLGYVDTTHITMKDSLDVQESSVNYAWRSYGVEISSNKLNVQSRVISKGNLYKENTNIKIEGLEKEVGSGSHVPLQVEIENLNDYYLPLTLYITKAPKEVEFNEKNILLKPKEIKKVFFIIEIPNELGDGFVYTSTLEITDSFDNSFSTNVKFGPEYNVYTLKEAQEKISKLEEEDKKIYSANIDLKCSKDKNFYYNYDNINISCSLRNIGNVNLDDLDLCYDDKCVQIDLSIGENKDFEINLDAAEIKNELAIKIESPEVSKNLFLDLNILKSPNITIKNLNYPKEVNYNDKYRISFTLASDSEAKNLLINLGNNNIFKIDSFKGMNDFNINFKGKEFYNKKLDLIIKYQDISNKTYSFIEKINIETENAPFYVKYYWLMIALVLIIIFSMIFRRKLRR